ncbi:hypothetical protein [Micromonospora aurantiaca (nom. illeg.)]|uniref:hypothetical protein n=1 Tax=Micromonospora aurantiaca (nom. illeg.) TaxID=47850 RepID=UPI003EB69650
MRHDQVGPHALPEVVGVEVVEVLDWYDGPLDGLARHGGQLFWFSAGPDWVPNKPRRLFLYAVTAEQEARLRAEAERSEPFAAAVPADGDALEPSGWFVA